MSFITYLQKWMYGIQMFTEGRFHVQLKKAYQIDISEMYFFKMYLWYKKCWKDYTKTHYNGKLKIKRSRYV